MEVLKQHIWRKTSTWPSLPFLRPILMHCACSIPTGLPWQVNTWLLNGSFWHAGCDRMMISATSVVARPGSEAVWSVTSPMCRWGGGPRNCSCDYAATGVMTVAECGNKTPLVSWHPVKSYRSQPRCGPWNRWSLIGYRLPGWPIISECHGIPPTTPC